MSKDIDHMLLSCPLLDRQIDEGACYDINAVADGWVKERILSIIEQQFKVLIDISKAKSVCPKCIHYPFEVD
ncbi:hypothetical protein [Paenibacillus silvisoli]|uniref:hypothetical protein n=1 Tax=Paenibacillus silvisoli TaxID=3110539 RepID=UPI0028051C29|nr:hypothetical protein [Paenibacillus silvisoli]